MDPLAVKLILTLLKNLLTLNLECIIYEQLQIPVSSIFVKGMHVHSLVLDS